MTGWIWLGAFLVLPVCGWPLLSHRAFRELPASSRLVLSGAAGAVLLSFAMTAAVLAGIPWNVGILAGAAALLAWALRALLPRHAEAPPGTPQAAAEPAWLAAAAHGLAALAVLLAIVATIAGATGSIDLVFFWGAKAQHFAAARTIDTTLFRDPFHQYMHAYYPPLVTNVDAYASLAAGRFVWTAAMLTFPLLLGALAVGLPGILRAATGSRGRSAASSALIVAAIGYLGMEADIGGNAEMPLLLFETLAMGLLLSPVSRTSAGQLLAGLLLGGAAATKVEGLPFAAASIVLFLALRTDARPAWSAVLRLGGPAVASLGAWFAFGATRGLFLGYSGSGRLFDLHADHLGDVLASLARALLGVGHGIPWFVPLACLLAALPLARRSLLPLGTAAALAGFFLFTYLHRAEDPTLWISWSAARVFAPVAMLLVLASMPSGAGAGEPGRGRASTP